MKRAAYRLLLASMLVPASLLAQAPGLSDADRNAIQALVTSYAQALAACRAEAFADLFVPETGYFASGFRGRFVGREKLIALVESERQCTAPQNAQRAARPGGAAGPTVELEVTPNGVRGIAELGTAEYQDEYAKTQAGWRFASRTVILDTEKAAGLDAGELLAIYALSGSELGDYYEKDQAGVPRLLTSGVRVSVSGDEVSGRAFLKDGSYDDNVYEKLGPGHWWVRSRTHIPPAAPL